MITFNGKPLCDNCGELPMTVHFDGWELCNDCVLTYKRHVYAIEDGLYEGYSQQYDMYMLDEMD